MKIKQISAANMSEALAIIKSELGADAAIISSEKKADGTILVMAAVDEDTDLSFEIEDKPEEVSTKPIFELQKLRECLDYHGVLDVVKDKILATAREIERQFPLKDEGEILIQTLSKLYAYSDILDMRHPVKLFMGTSGSGKSTAIAKTATQAKFQKISCCIISTDNVRAGANKQLEAFAKILETDFYFCPEEKALLQKVKEAKEKYGLVLIDTPGINPFIDKEVLKVENFCRQIKGQFILTMDSGRNTIEAVEIAEIFAEIGAKYLLPTRLDLTRRIGTVLSVAACCDMSFCAASVSSSIANGLSAIDAQSLSRLVLSAA